MIDLYLSYLMPVLAIGIGIFVIVWKVRFLFF